MNIIEYRSKKENANAGEENSHTNRPAYECFGCRMSGMLKSVI